MAICGQFHQQCWNGSHVWLLDSGSFRDACAPSLRRKYVLLLAPRPLLLVGVLLLHLELDDKDYGMINMLILPDLALALLTWFAGRNAGGRLVAE
jgi:hypothetical protein